MKRVFKWYILPDCIMPEHGELVHFDDTHNIMHLGRYNKKDQFGREDVFITTEGAHFTKDKVEAWIPAPHSRFEKEAIECDSCNELAKEVMRVVKERDNYKNYTLKAIGYKERIIELEQAFAGAEEMVKDKIKKISELEKAILLLTEVVDEQQQRLKTETSGELFKRIIK